MISNRLAWFSIPLAAVIGGCSNVPLGFVCLTENLMMLAVTLWMLVAVPGGAVCGAQATHSSHRMPSGSAKRRTVPFPAPSAGSTFAPSASSSPPTRERSSFATLIA